MANRCLAECMHNRIRMIGLLCDDKRNHFEEVWKCLLDDDDFREVFLVFYDNNYVMLALVALEARCPIDNIEICLGLDLDFRITR